DDLPGSGLLLVVLLARRTQHRLGEVVNPLLDLELVLVELKAEVAHGVWASWKHRYLAGAVERLRGLFGATHRSYPLVINCRPSPGLVPNPSSPRLGPNPTATKLRAAPTAKGTPTATSNSTPAS